MARDKRQVTRGKRKGINGWVQAGNDKRKVTNYCLFLVCLLPPFSYNGRNKKLIK